MSSGIKYIKVKKSNYFSTNSKLFINAGSRKTQLSGYRPYTIEVNEGETISASQLWTGSNTIQYDKLENGSSLIVNPKLSRLLALIIGITFITCSLIFFLTRILWSLIPMIPFEIYIIIYITILKNRYLILEEEDRS
jgi:hypothetical protein